MALQTLQRESRYQEERAKDLDRKVSRLELECHNEEQNKECVRKSMHDFVRRLGSTLGTDAPDATAGESLIIKTHELVQVKTFFLVLMYTKSSSPRQHMKLL